MRRSTILITLSCACLTLATAAQASIFGPTGPLGSRAASGIEYVGAYLGLASGETGGAGQIRFGLNKDTDIGVQGALTKASGGGPTEVGAQVDLKASLANLSKTNKSFRVGGDASVGFSHVTGSTAFTLSAIPTISGGTEVGSGQMLSGYAGVGISWTHVTGGSTTAGVFDLGAAYDVTKKIAITGVFNQSLKTGGGNSFAAGVNFLMGK